MLRPGLARALLLIALITLGLAGCKRELPPPWRDVHFPLTNAELLPGADQNGFSANYPPSTPVPDLFREYQRALEGSGWAVLKQGSSHDPVNGAFAVIMNRGADKVLLTITAGKPVQARITTSVD